MPAQGITVYVHTFQQSRERFIFVTVNQFNEDDDLSRNEEKDTEQVGESRGNRSPLRISPPQSEYDQKWEHHAYVRGCEKARADIPEKSAEEDLWDMAEKMAYNDFETYYPTQKSMNDRDVDELVRVFNIAFIAAYKGIFQKQGYGDDLPDRFTLVVRDKARSDRSLSLSESQIPVRGTISALEALFKFQMPVDQISRVENLAHSYAQEVQGKASSERFPSSQK